MTRVTKTFSLNVQAAVSGAPAWFTNLPERTWTAIAGGTGQRIYDVLPADWSSYGGSGWSDITTAYVGGCANQATKELYLAANGGHIAYGGNEIYALQLNQATPAWARIWGPSALPADYSDTGNNPAICKFNSTTLAPRSVHTWFVMQCDRNGRIWMIWMPSYHEPNGRVANTCWSIDRNNLGAGWMHHGRTWAEASAVESSPFGCQAAPSAYDSVGHALWVTPEGDVRGDGTNYPTRKIDCAAAVAAGQQPETGPQVPGSSKLGTWYGTSYQQAWSVILSDKTPRCWLVNGNSGLSLFNVETPGTFTSVSATGSNPGRGGRNAFYVPSHSAVYVFGTAQGGTVSKLTITGSNPTTATYAWSTLSNNTGSATPAWNGVGGGPYNGDWGKAQGIVDMGDGRSALVIAPNVQGPAYVYKLPASF